MSHLPAHPSPPAPQTPSPNSTEIQAVTYQLSATQFQTLIQAAELLVSASEEPQAEQAKAMLENVINAVRPSRGPG